MHDVPTSEDCLSKHNHVIVDLDGTMCDNTERSKDLDETSRDSWDRFFSRANEDRPIEPIISWIKEIGNHYSIDIITSRPETIRDITVKWLKEYDVEFDTLWMRDLTDLRYSAEYKHAKLQALKNSFPLGVFWLAFEDDPECIQMYQDMGLKVVDARLFTPTRDVGTNLSKIRDK